MARVPEIYFTYYIFVSYCIFGFTYDAKMILINRTSIFTDEAQINEMIDMTEVLHLTCNMKAMIGIESLHT